jgi:phospholipase/carboxylesterase
MPQSNPIFPRLTRVSRPPLEATQPTPTLVLLHGIGSHEEDLMGLASELDPRLHLVSYRAPRAYGPGYSWFDIQWDGDTIHFDEQQAEEALGILQREIDMLPAELGVDPDSIMIAGFSQGGAMTTALLASRPSIKGAMVLSGRLSKHLKVPEIPKTPVLVQHGLYDNVIPIESARRITRVLTDAGADVTHREYPMGHEVSQDSLRDLAAWLTAQL